MNILNEKRKAQGWMARCSSAPDMTAMNTTAAAQAALSEEQLDWAKSVYAEQAPQRDAAFKQSQDVSNAQLGVMNQQMALAKDYNDYNKSTFRPLEKGIVADAQNYDTQARRDSEAGKAIADVTQGFSAARDQSSRNLQRMGVDPNSGRALSLSNSLDIGQAANMAGAASKARNMVETTGFARKMDAASLGRGLASAQSTAAGLGLNAGSSALGSTGVGLASMNSGNQVMQQGFSGASQGLSSAGSMYGNIANVQNQADANGNAIWGGLGQIGGAAIGKWG